MKKSFTGPLLLLGFLLSFIPTWADSDATARLYNFTPNTTISSGQVNGELNNIINVLNAKVGNFNNSTIGGIKSFSGSILTDNLTELTAGHGVTMTTAISPVIAGDPTGPANGMVWYNSSVNDLRAYVNGSTISLGTPTGVVQDYVGTTAPGGWVFLDGKTIGDASSSASSRSNADTVNLFTLLWNSFADAQAPVSSGRGASAAADFAAHKTITLPDTRGRIVIAKDNLGGTAANRVTSASLNGANAVIQGGTGGEQAHAQTIAELAAHTHSLPSVYNGGGSGAFAAGSGTLQPINITGSTGSGTAFNVMQPWIAMSKIIKL